MRPEGAIIILLSDILHNQLIIMISSVLKVFRSHCPIPWVLKNYPQQDFFLFLFFLVLNDSINGASTGDRLFKSYFRTLFSPLIVSLYVPLVNLIPLLMAMSTP